MMRRNVPRVAGRALRTVLAGGGAMAMWAAVSPGRLLPLCFVCICGYPTVCPWAQCGGSCATESSTLSARARTGTCHGSGKSICRSCHGGGTAVPIAAKVVKRWVLQRAFLPFHRALQPFYTALQLHSKTVSWKCCKGGVLT